MTLSRLRQAINTVQEPTASQTGLDLDAINTVLTDGPAPCASPGVAPAAVRVPVPPSYTPPAAVLPELPAVQTHSVEGWD